MKTKWLMALFFVLALSLPSLLAWAADAPQFPENASFKTLITTTRAIEGLTGDNSGNLHTGGSGASPCPVWEINLNNPALTPVGFIVPADGTCNFSGIAFNDLGDLFVADGADGTIYTFKPSASNPPNASVFALGVPGTNGLAFDRDGNLWTGDGTTGLGRVWKIAPCATLPCPANEVFRIQPMANDLNPVTTGGISNVGSDRRTLPPGTINAARMATNTLGSQPLVANGVAFNHQGDLFVADTARGAIWKVELDRNGFIKEGQFTLDTTFTSNTLRLSNIFVAHPILEGADGIALDQAGNIWVAANERNAVAVVTKGGRVIEVFRNPVNTNTQLRNSATAPANNNRILEFPASPFLSGKVFCTSNSDGNRRDNFPNTEGEVKPAGPAIGKISCMTDQAGNPLELNIPGLPLPIQ
jgi:sugar lactone lactonase YvrE